MSKTAPTKRPIVIKKIKKAGHAHHGGSWKVAYADFVTAMMAFFMVMWIVGMDDATKKSIESYFSNPNPSMKGSASGTSPIGHGSKPVQLNPVQVKQMIRVAEEKSFKAAADRIRARLDSARGSLGTAKFEVTVTEGGLRIELIEGEAGDSYFARGSGQMRTAAKVGLVLIASELSALRNPVVLEGHTDGSHYGSSASYSNWELSADRANAARRMLEEASLDSKRIVEVRGYADTRLRNAKDPSAPENRRISIFLPFSDVKAKADSLAVN